jgi:hypothetical protein
LVIILYSWEIISVVISDRDSRALPTYQSPPKYLFYFNLVNKICCILPGKLYRYKGKAIPLQVLRGPEGSRRLRLPDFKTIGS